VILIFLDVAVAMLPIENGETWGKKKWIKPSNKWGCSGNAGTMSVQP